MILKSRTGSPYPGAALSRDSLARLDETRLSAAPDAEIRFYNRTQTLNSK